jgi:hypothetical protein
LDISRNILWFNPDKRSNFSINKNNKNLPAGIKFHVFGFQEAVKIQQTEGI